MHLDVHAGIIRRAAFRGDFFGTAPCDELAAQLTGCPHRADAIRAALSCAGVGRYIAGLEPEPLAELLAP